MREGKSLDAVIASCIFVAACCQVLSLGHSARFSAASPFLAKDTKDPLPATAATWDLPPNFQAICGGLIKLTCDQCIGDGFSPFRLLGKSAKEISQLAEVSKSIMKLMYWIYYYYKERLIIKKQVESG